MISVKLTALKILNCAQRRLLFLLVLSFFTLCIFIVVLLNDLSDGSDWQMGTTHLLRVVVSSIVVVVGVNFKGRFMVSC